MSDTKAAGRVQEQARRQVQNLRGFDHSAAAKLFPNRSNAVKSRAKYMRFPAAPEAVRFLVEELPTPVLLGAYLVVAIAERAV